MFLSRSDDRQERMIIIPKSGTTYILLRDELRL